MPNVHGRAYIQYCYVANVERLLDLKFDWATWQDVQKGFRSRAV